MTDADISTITKYGDAPIFVFCDHASNAVPDDLNCLGLPDDLLETHIAWDIGAGALTLEVAQRLNATALCNNLSRLVIDVNRAISAPDLIPAVSDQIPIPGNQMMSDGSKEDRIRRFHTPYHEHMKNALDDIAAAGPVFVVSIHSFTRRLMGAAEDRPWPIGLLWRHDEKSARSAINFLSNETGWPIGDNEPYDARVFNFTIDHHIAPRDWPHLTLEVRQDKIADTAGVDEMADILARCIERTMIESAENVIPFSEGSRR